MPSPPDIVSVVSKAVVLTRMLSSPASPNIYVAPAPAFTMSIISFPPPSMIVLVFPVAACSLINTLSLPDPKNIVRPVTSPSIVFVE